MAYSATRQLETLLKYEQDKESLAAQELSAAEVEYQNNIARLNDVGQYRLEYMKRLSTRSQSGIDSFTYNHYVSFVSKLDNAAEQVKIAMIQAQSLAKQCKQYWLAQQQKVKAVELLIEKRSKKIAIQNERLEQKEFDEIASQQFIRKYISSNK